MTREEAINELTEELVGINPNDLGREEMERYAVAITMAVEALKEQITRGECKTCKYFEYDHVDKLYGIPLILAHEICTKWGDGCKTSENGYCFLYEPKESGGRQ